LPRSAFDHAGQNAFAIFLFRFHAIEEHPSDMRVGAVKGHEVIGDDGLVVYGRVEAAASFAALDYIPEGDTVLQQDARAFCIGRVAREPERHQWHGGGFVSDKPEHNEPVMKMLRL
jgi:hypothetical protein